MCRGVHCFTHTAENVAWQTPASAQGISSPIPCMYVHSEACNSVDKMEWPHGVRRTPKVPPTAVPRIRSTPLETVVSTFSDSTTATWAGTPTRVIHVDEHLLQSASWVVQVKSVIQCLSRWRLPQCLVHSCSRCKKAAAHSGEQRLACLQGSMQCLGMISSTLQGVVPFSINFIHVASSRVLMQGQQSKGESRTRSSMIDNAMQAHRLCQRGTAPRL